MLDHAGCKGRLTEILDILRIYQGWNKEQLGRGVGRDPSHIIPDKKYPAIDMVARIADGLDWSISEVVEALVTPDEPDAEPDELRRSSAELQQDALAAHIDGDSEETVRLAKLAYAAATSNDERAIACLREHGGWDRVGRHHKALDAAQRAVDAAPRLTAVRHTAESNLASSYYMLWRLNEGIGIAATLLDEIEETPYPEQHADHKAATAAWAYYIRGSCYRRRLATAEDAVFPRYARLARNDLRKAFQQFRHLAKTSSVEDFHPLELVSFGAYLEAMAACGTCEPAKALARIHNQLDELTDVQSMPPDDVLEAYGWWCVFGCNITLRHLSHNIEQQQLMAVLTNKAGEIAERTGNWTLHERVFTMEHTRRQLLDHAGHHDDWLLDESELKILAGTIGRFPRFRRVGMQIYRNAVLIPA